LRRAIERRIARRTRRREKDGQDRVTEPLRYPIAVPGRRRAAFPARRRAR
jgi:hypothetical protein